MNEYSKRVSIITVNFNQPLVTEAMLASVFLNNTYPDIEIIVVDNGSTHDPVPAWKVKYPAVQFIRSEINTGFAGGNNIGIKRAKGAYLFLVNNDTEFTGGLVTQLVETLEIFPATGMVSPKIRYYQQPDTLQYAGYTNMNFYTGRNACIGQFEKDNGQYDHVTGITGYAHGAAMMVRREVIARAGLMYENYFLYYEEMDWCERIRQKGFEIRINMQALIYHKESVSVGQKSALKEYFMNRNRVLFIRRNAKLYQQWIFFFYFMVAVVPRNIIVYCKHKQWGFIAVLFRSVWWNITHEKNSPELGFKMK